MPCAGMSPGWTLSPISGTAGAPVPDYEPEPAGTLPQVDQQVPCLLHSPRAVRARGDTDDMHVTGAHLDFEDTYNRRKVTAQSRWKKSQPASRMPACAGIAAGGPAVLRRGRHPQPFEDPPDRGRPDPEPRPSSPPWIRR